LGTAARGYTPRTGGSMLNVPAYEVPAPRFPAVNVHAHLRGEFGLAWAGKTSDEIVAALDASGLERIVSLDGGFGQDLIREIDRLQAAHPDRVAVFAHVDYSSFGRERFGRVEADRLRESVAAGARGLKVWKILGLVVRDASGQLIGLDDERLSPIWEAAGDLEVPVLIHFADPRAFFQPLTPDNERWLELRRHPDWHRYPCRRPGDRYDPRPPSHDELHEQFERLIASQPSTRFIAAHMASSGEDLERLGLLLNRYPNLYVDMSAALNELGRQPYTSRDFLIRFQDRVLFGTDTGPDPAACRVYYRYLETRAEYAEYAPGGALLQGDWRIYGVDLPDEALRKIYSDNAMSLIRFDR
jgi:predicted TIM-barrel fold metal-dependent hydrolase